MNEINLSIIEDYLQKKNSLAFMDINLWIGPPLEAGFLDKRTFQEVITLAKENGITGGIISHSTGLFYDAKIGNEILFENFIPEPFFAGITIVPELFYDAKQGREYLAKAINQGARLARVYPKAGSFEFRPWNVGGMIEALSEFNLPLLVWQTQINWDDVDAVCSAFPGLQLILEGNPQKILYHNRRFYALLEKHGNFKLETHNVIGYLAVEDIVNRFGADRLVFGSYFPYWDPNATMMAVTHARISDMDKEKIAHGNLMQIIKSVEVKK